MNSVGPLMNFPLAADFAYGLTSVKIAVLVAGAAIIFSVRRWRMNVVRKRRSGNRDSAPSLKTDVRMPPSNALSVREVGAEIQALLAELEETNRRIAAQMENRRVRLEQLIVEADEKIKRLESLTGAAPTTLPRASAAPAAMSAQRDAAQTLSRLRQERGAPPANEDPAYLPIYQLADQGKSAREIGQALGRQPGEIELILALRGRQQA